MKSLKSILTAVAVVVTMVFATTSLYSAISAAAPDKLVIKEFKKKKPAVPFPHKQHVDAKISCKKCHHTTEAGATPKKCSECHKAEKGDAPDAKKAFHKSCTPCHKKAEKKGEKTGPTKCGDCHAG